MQSLHRCDAGHAPLEDSTVICELQLGQDEAGRLTFLQPARAQTAAAAAEHGMPSSSGRSTYIHASYAPGNALHWQPSGSILAR